MNEIKKLIGVFRIRLPGEPLDCLPIEEPLPEQSSYEDVECDESSQVNILIEQ